MKLDRVKMYHKLKRPFKIMLGAGFLTIFGPDAHHVEQSISLSKNEITNIIISKEPDRKKHCTKISTKGLSTTHINALFSEHRLVVANKFDEQINKKHNSGAYRELIYRMIHWIDHSMHSDDIWLVDSNLLSNWILSLDEKSVLGLLEKRQIIDKHKPHDIIETNTVSKPFCAHFEKHDRNRNTLHQFKNQTIVIKHLTYSNIQKKLEKLPIGLYSTRLGGNETGTIFDPQGTHIEGFSTQVVECIMSLANEFEKSDYSGNLLISGGTESGHSGATNLKERNAAGGDVYYYGRKTKKISPLKSWHGLGLSFDLLLTKSTYEFMKNQFGIKKIGKMYDASIGGHKVKILLHDSNGIESNHVMGLHYHIQMNF